MGTSKLEDEGLLVIELVDSVSEVDVAELLNIELDTTKVVGLVNS